MQAEFDSIEGVAVFAVHVGLANELALLFFNKSQSSRN
jgi:hypothetical protein